MNQMNFFLLLKKNKNYNINNNINNRIYDYSYDNNTINYNLDNTDDYRILYPLKYLIKYNIYSPNKTLVFLQKNNNTLFFIEDSYIIFSYKFDLEEKITRFKVNPPNSYHIYTKNKKIKGQMIFYCCLKEKKFYIKHIKIYEV